MIWHYIFNVRSKSQASFLHQATSKLKATEKAKQKTDEHKNPINSSQRVHEVYLAGEVPVVLVHGGKDLWNR